MAHRNNELAIQACGLAKRFGDVQAVSKIDLEVAQGEALGLLGPNGAGKSTTLSLLMGLRRPDSGRIQVFGHEAGSDAARRLMGATPQSTGFPDQLTPGELLHYTAARYGQAADVKGLVERFGLRALIDRRVAGFSGGEMRRVALALAFVGQPRLVFLDEPTTGLDTAAQDAFRQAARDYVAAGGTLVLTSHHWDEIEAVCGRIALIDRGETVLTEHLEDMRARTAINRVSFELPEGQEPPDWMETVFVDGRWRMETPRSDAVLRRLVEDAVPFQALTLEPLQLKQLIDRIRHEETVQ